MKYIAENKNRMVVTGKGRTFIVRKGSLEVLRRHVQSLEAPKGTIKKKIKLTLPRRLK